MGDLLTFAPRPRPAAPLAPEPLTDDALRTRIEAAAEVAVDTAQRLIAILDRMDGEPDLEDGGDAEPSLGAPEGHDNQVTWLRGGDEDREAEAGETALPDAVLDPEPVPIAIVIPLPLVPRNGRGSLCTSAAVHLFDLLAGEG